MLPLWPDALVFNTDVPDAYKTGINQVRGPKVRGHRVRGHRVRGHRLC